MGNITTTTHDITAAYMINNIYHWHPVDINGDDLDEIVSDMLEFWNEHPETVGVFTAEDPDTVDDTTVVGISGQVQAYDSEGFLSDTETDDIYVLISADPR